MESQTEIKGGSHITISRNYCQVDTQLSWTAMRYLSTVYDKCKMTSFLELTKYLDVEFHGI